MADSLKYSYQPVAVLLSNILNNPNTQDHDYGKSINRDTDIKASVHSK